jgi:hypothetical protein
MHEYFFPYALEKNKGWNINYWQFVREHIVANVQQNLVSILMPLRLVPSVRLFPNLIG